MKGSKELMRKTTLWLSLSLAWLAATLGAEDGQTFKNLDLRAKANMGFQDELAGDRRGGWDDSGANDMRGFPVGKRTFAGVPFDIADRGNAIVVLKGENKPYFPAAAMGIPVDAFVKTFYFLTACTFNSPEGAPVAKYVVRYDNGLAETFTVRFGVDIGNNWLDCNPAIMLNATPVEWTGSNPQCGRLGAFVAKWDNPHANFKVKTVDFVSLCGVEPEAKSTPVLIALTARTVKPPLGDQSELVDLLKRLEAADARLKELDGRVKRLEELDLERKRTIERMGSELEALWNEER